jgi:hypothetical protein
LALNPFFPKYYIINNRLKYNFLQNRNVCIYSHIYIELALSPFFNIYYFYRTERLKLKFYRTELFYRTEQLFTEQNHFTEQNKLLQNRTASYRTEDNLTEQNA